MQQSVQISRRTFKKTILVKTESIINHAYLQNKVVVYAYVIIKIYKFCYQVGLDTCFEIKVSLSVELI